MKGTFLAAGGDSEGSEKMRSLQRDENRETDMEEEERKNFLMEHLGFSRDLRAIVLQNGGAGIMVTLVCIVVSDLTES